MLSVNTLRVCLASIIFSMTSVSRRVPGAAGNMPKRNAAEPPFIVTLVQAVLGMIAIGVGGGLLGRGLAWMFFQ